MIKYKEAGNGQFIKITIDENQKEIKSASFGPNSKPKTMGAGFYKEMQEYLKTPGTTVEAQYTPEEQTIKDEKEADEAEVAWIGERKSEYPTIDELTVALWEKIVENRPESADALEIKRQAIKEKIQKPS